MTTTFLASLDYINDNQMYVEFTFSKPTFLRTAGDGLWSGKSKLVKITSVVVDGFNPNDEVNCKEYYKEMRVYFDTDTWDIEEDGLIYTDDKFEQELHLALLKEFGTDGACNIYYSEQGMQGEDYVSFDCDGIFWDNLARELQKLVDGNDELKEKIK